MRPRDGKNVSSYMIRRRSVMDLQYKSQQKSQELKMKKKAEQEPDLGYLGSFSGMKCSELKEIGDRLECHYDKYIFKDPLAKLQIKRKALERKRQGRHGYAIKKICLQEEPMLCAIKDRDDEDKEQDHKCLELNACPEPDTTLNDIIDDTKEFYKILIKAMDFSPKKKSKKRNKNTKELSKLRDKMKKELQAIKEEYDSLIKASSTTTPSSTTSTSSTSSTSSTTPSTTPSTTTTTPTPTPTPTSSTPSTTTHTSSTPSTQKGGKILGKRFGEFSDKLDKYTGTASCQRKIATGRFDEDWKTYQKCVLDYEEGAPQDAAQLIQDTKEKFSTLPLIPRHLELLEKYQKKKKLMMKTNSSGAQKLKSLKNKMRGKLAAYKVTGQKAKNDFMDIDKFRRAKYYGKSTDANRTPKNLDSLRKDPKLNEKVTQEAYIKASEKLDELNKKRVKKGLPPFIPDSEEASNFLKTETAKQKKKLIEDPGRFAKIKKEKLRQDVKDQMNKSGLNSNLIKTSGTFGFDPSSRNLRKKLKKMKQMNSKVAQRTQKYMKQGMSQEAASKLARDRVQSNTVRSSGRSGSTKQLIENRALAMGVNSSMLKTGYFGRRKTLRQLNRTAKLKQRAIATGTNEKEAQNFTEARILGKSSRFSSLRNAFGKQANSMSKDIFGTKSLKRSKQMAKDTKKIKDELEKAGINSEKALKIAVTSSRANAGRFFKNKELKELAQNSSKEALGLNSGIRYNKVGKFAKNIQNFKKSDVANSLRKEIMATGTSEEKANELVDKYARGRAAKKTRKGRNWLGFQRQGNEKQKDRDFAAESLKELGYNEYMTSSELKKTLKKRDQAKQELNNAKNIYGIEIPDGNSLQQYLGKRSREKRSREKRAYRIFGSKKKTAARKKAEQNIHSQMLRNNPELSSRVGETAFSFTDTNSIKSKIKRQ